MCHRHDSTPNSDEIHSKLILKLNIIHLSSSLQTPRMHVFIYLLLSKEKAAKEKKYAKRTEATDNDDDDDDSIF